MATRADVRRIITKLPDTTEDADRFAFSVGGGRGGKAKGFAWVWMERVEPKKARVPNPKVLAVRVPNVGEKDALIASDPDIYFTEPHYNGFPAVLVRLAAISRVELEELLIDAWRCQAPKPLVREYDAAHPA
jgi:hypothetical protein